MPSLRRLRQARRFKRRSALGWGALAEAALIAGGHWRALPLRKRRRLRKLLGASRGWPANLSAAQRSELAALLSSIDAKGLLRELLALRRGRRARRGRALRSLGGRGR